MSKTKICPYCNSEFAVNKRGRSRTYCSDRCREDNKINSEARNRNNWNTCSTDGCNTKVRSPNAKLCGKCHSLWKKKQTKTCQVHKCDEPATRNKHTICEKHYYRMRRNGSYELLNQPIFLYYTNQGYVKVLDRSHPLSSKDGYVMEHRKVVYDEIGKGPHACTWCGEILGWDEAVVDHLNEQKDDNQIDNLVYSCNNCNRARGAAIPFIENLTEDGLELFIEQAKKHWQNTNS